MRQRTGSVYNRQRKANIKPLVAIGCLVAAGLIAVGHALWTWIIPAPPTRHQFVVNAARAACDKHVYDGRHNFESLDESTIRKIGSDKYSVDCAWFDGQDINGGRVYTDQGTDSISFTVAGS